MDEMSYCREALRRLSGDGPVLVKSLTARRQHEDSGHTEPAYNAGLMDGENIVMVAAEYRRKQNKENAGCYPAK